MKKLGFKILREINNRLKKYDKRICSTCKLIKSNNEFSVYKNIQRTSCRCCYGIYRMEYYNKNKEAFKKYMKDYRFLKKIINKGDF